MDISFKENTITKLQELYSPPRNLRAGNKSPVLFLKKPLCTGDLLPSCKIFTERPDTTYSFVWVIFKTFSQQNSWLNVKDKIIEKNTFVTFIFPI